MAGDVLAGLFVVAVIYVLVRPRSAGVAFVQAVGSALTAIVKSAADLATT